MKSAEVLWSLMKSSEVFWSLLKSSEVCWGLVKSHEISWSPLKSPEVSWSPWSPQNLLKSFEIPWSLLKVSWSLLKSSEVFWSPLKILKSLLMKSPEVLKSWSPLFPPRSFDTKFDLSSAWYDWERTRFLEGCFMQKNTKISLTEPLEYFHNNAMNSRSTELPLILSESSSSAAQNST